MVGNVAYRCSPAAADGLIGWGLVDELTPLIAHPRREELEVLTESLACLTNTTFKCSLRPANDMVKTGVVDHLVAAIVVFPPPSHPHAGGGKEGDVSLWALRALQNVFYNCGQEEINECLHSPALLSMLLTVTGR